MLSVGLTLAVGVALTRRSLERSTLANLGRRADLIAEREREALLPLGRLGNLRRYLSERGERIEVVSLGQATQLLTPAERARLRAQLPVQGTVELEQREYYYAARGIGRRALVLLRPTSLQPADWQPFLQGLLIAGLLGASLAALASLVLARAISRPLRNVAQASRSLAAGASPEPVPVEGSAELASLARSFNEMAAQLARAREAERAFLLSVSHELKTPLTAIRGYAEGLAEDAVPPLEAGEVIAREAGRLERLVRDLLELARMNRSEFTVTRSRVELDEIAHEVVQRYEGQARAFDVGLGAEIASPVAVSADPDRLVQVVSNLVENALRVTPPGGSVTVRAEGDAIAVTDSGPGLRDDELSRAFERFFLYSRYGGERRVGTGLGLAIVKELTLAMGGAVEVRSRLGEGTTFVVRLQSEPRPAEPAAVPMQF